MAMKIDKAGNNDRITYVYDFGMRRYLRQRLWTSSGNPAILDY